MELLCQAEALILHFPLTNLCVLLLLLLQLLLFLSLANPVHTPEWLKQWLLLLLQLVCLMLLYHQTIYLVYNKRVIITLCECQFVSIFDLVKYVCTLYNYDMKMHLIMTFTSQSNHIHTNKTEQQKILFDVFLDK